MHSRHTEPPDCPELRELERALAYEGAVATLDGLCGTVDDTEIPGATWSDLSILTDYERVEVERSVRYLELRGLLARHPEHDHLVRALALPPGAN